MHNPFYKSRWRLAQAFVGIFNATLMVFHLNDGQYVRAAIDVVCLAITADWCMPGESPRSSWLLRFTLFLMGRSKGKPEDLEIARLQGLVLRIGRLAEETAVAVFGPERQDAPHCWDLLPETARAAREANDEAREAAAALAVWWARREQQEGAPLDDAAPVLELSGAVVTAGEVRRLLAAIYAIKPGQGSHD